MLDFQAVKTTLEQANLAHEEWEQVAQLVNQRRQSGHINPKSVDPEVWMASLNAAIDAFWEGVTPEEKAELLEAWNKNDEPVVDESHLFDWIDELPADER